MNIPIYRPTVLHIDDAQLIRLSVGDYLRDNGYDVQEAASAREGLSMLKTKQPDIVITDLRMPKDDGQDVIAAIKQSSADIPVIVLSGTSRTDEIIRLLRNGAWDFIPKPVLEMNVIRTSIETALSDVRARREQLRIIADLQREVFQLRHERRTLHRQLKRTMDTTVGTLGVIVAHKDPYTAGHNERVARIAVQVAQTMGLDEKRVETLRLAAILHDIGKVAVPAAILNKPDRLTPEENAKVRLHAETGYEILQSLPFSGPVAEIVRQHHERYDGSGYPRGLTGEKILLEARILAVVDIYEALTANRPYRKAMPHTYTLGYIARHSASLLCPECVRAFLVTLKRNSALITENLSIESGSDADHDKDLLNRGLCPAPGQEAPCC